MELVKRPEPRVTIPKALALIGRQGGKVTIR